MEKDIFQQYLKGVLQDFVSTTGICVESVKVDCIDGIITDVELIEADVPMPELN